MYDCGCVCVCVCRNGKHEYSQVTTSVHRDIKTQCWDIPSGHVSRAIYGKISTPLQLSHKLETE